MNKKSIYNVITWGCGLALLTSLVFIKSVEANLPFKPDRTFSVNTGGTRIIYNTSDKSASISISNPQDYPILVQSKVYTEDKKTLGSFTVTPPLFRLEANKSNRLRIIPTTKLSGLSKETLNWLCIMAIPPKEDDVWGEGNKNNFSINTQMRVTNCLKIFVRPSNLSFDLDKVNGNLKWKQTKNMLELENPTPFYVNFKNITVGDVNIINPDMVYPFSKKTYQLNEGSKSKQLKWTVLTDTGGISKVFEENLGN